MQYPRVVGPIVNDQAPFTSSMTQGCLPQRNRQFLAPQIPLPWSQTTHIAAPFSMEMAQGARPERSRAPKPQGGWSDSQTTHVPAPFATDMAVGSHPDQSRAWLPLRVGWATSQLTHVPAVFSVEMAQGWQPATGRRSSPFTSGGIFVPPAVLAFAFESLFRYAPDSPRLFLGPRIDLPGSQQVHIPAAFSLEMVQGSQPLLGRRSSPYTSGGAFVPPDVIAAIAFAIESIFGSLPSSPRLFRTPRTDLPANQQVHIPALFSVEMAVGSHPDSPRLFSPHVGWSVSQPTHVPAPFSIEMISASAPQARHTQRGVWIIQRGRPTGGSDIAAYFPTVTAGHKVILVNGRVAIHLSGILYEFHDGL